MLHTFSLLRYVLGLCCMPSVSYTICLQVVSLKDLVLSLGWPFGPPRTALGSTTVCPSAFLAGRVWIFLYDLLVRIQTADSSGIVAFIFACMCTHVNISEYDFGVKFSHEGKEYETAYTSGVCVRGVLSCFCWTECFSFFLELRQLGQLKVFLQSGSRPVTVFFRSLSSCLHWIKSWASPWRLHMCLLCSFPSAPSNTISWSLLPHSCPLALC